MRKYITIVIKDQGRGHNLQSTPIRNLPCVVLDDKAAYVTILVYVLEKKFQQISYCNNMSVFHYFIFFPLFSNNFSPDTWNEVRLCLMMDVLKQGSNRVVTLSPGIQRRMFTGELCILPGFTADEIHNLSKVRYLKNNFPLSPIYTGSHRYM